MDPIIDMEQEEGVEGSPQQKRRKTNEGEAESAESPEGSTIVALQDKVQELRAWVEALKKENKTVQAELRHVQAEAKTRQAAKTTTTGYGFTGAHARPKDIAVAAVTGSAAAPVQMSATVEGGGAVWEQQPVVGLRPIGYLESCFLEKNGTPRQGNVAPTSRATLTVLFGTNPAHCLQGIEDFSHVWVLWLFHDNGNKRLAPLVHPPRLDGGKKGIFATRTPHRPNPIGLSLCKLESVRGSVITLSGVDIIHGTPILDIKPYIPTYDNEDNSADIRVPEWISNPPISKLEVKFSALASEQLTALMDTFRFFRTHEEVRCAIRDVLHSDPRSVHMRNKMDLSSTAPKSYIFALDSVDITCRFDGDEAIVEEVVPVYSKLQSELRQKAAGGTELGSGGAQK